MKNTRIFTPAELQAFMAYKLARRSEQTPNIHGIHIGDIFVSTWGYDMTNNDFYQVVGVKGKMTVQVRRIASTLNGEGAGYDGTEYAVRDSFMGDEVYTVRSSDRCTVSINDPRFKGHRATATTEAEGHYYNTLD